VWAPSEAEIEHSRKVIDAFNAARAEGKGVVQLDGKMIENLHVANAERILAVAEAIAELA
jgi:citrate lyase subunit beta/citryl-CoA lyase